MTNTENTDGEPARRRPRIRFSLLALLIFITLACFLLAYFVQPQRVVVTTLFQVDSTSPLSGDARQVRAMDERAYELLKRSQVALLESKYLLNAAVRNPAIGSLPFFQDNPDPVDWLKENLVVEYPYDSEILSISLNGTQAQEQDLVKIVDAVAKAYQDEVINKERMQRLSDRDLVARNLENINGDFKRKSDEYLDISRELDKLSDGGGEIRQQIEMKRLDRIDEELIRLESEQAAAGDADSAKSKSMDARIKQLREQLSQLQQSLSRRAEKSTDLESRRQELDQLRRVSDDMSMQLQHLDIEASNPSQIQLIQPAEITRK